jgi:ankyrin repeat protein
MEADIDRAFTFIETGEWEKLRALLFQNHQLAHAKDRFGESLLMHCARYPWSDSVVRQLISLGADPNERASDNSNVLSRAIYGSEPSHGSNTLSIVETLLQCGADPNAIADAGMPSLHWAITNARFNAARLLIRYGANVEAMTSDSPPESLTDIATRMHCLERLSEVVRADI